MARRFLKGDTKSEAQLIVETKRQLALLRLFIAQIIKGFLLFILFFVSMWLFCQYIFWTECCYWRLESEAALQKLSCVVLFGCWLLASLLTFPGGESSVGGIHWYFCWFCPFSWTKIGNPRLFCCNQVPKEYITALKRIPATVEKEKEQKKPCPSPSWTHGGKTFLFSLNRACFCIFWYNCVCLVELLHQTGLHWNQFSAFLTSMETHHLPCNVNFNQLLGPNCEHCCWHYNKKILQVFTKFAVVTAKRFTQEVHVACCEARRCQLLMGQKKYTERTVWLSEGSCSLVPPQFKSSTPLQGYIQIVHVPKRQTNTWIVLFFGCKRWVDSEPKPQDYRRWPVFAFKPLILLLGSTGRLWLLVFVFDVSIAHHSFALSFDNGSGSLCGPQGSCPSLVKFEMHDEQNAGPKCVHRTQQLCSSTKDVISDNYFCSG